VVFAAVVVFALGCAQKSPEGGSPPNDAPATSTSAPKDASAALYEQLRAGAYQVDAAMGAMERAMNEVRPLAQDKPEETKEALQTVADLLDSAGATVVEFNDAPTEKAVKADFSGNDERRLKAIEETNDARQDVDTARGYVTDLLASEPPQDVRAKLEEIDDAIEEALDALEAAIEALGGKVEDGDSSH
jgi:predicted outer membrane protein